MWDPRHRVAATKEQHSVFASDIGSMIRNHCPLLWESWKAVRHEVKEAILHELSYINNLCAGRFTQCKSDLHKHYELYDGPEGTLAVGCPIKLVDWGSKFPKIDMFNEVYLQLWCSRVILVSTLVHGEVLWKDPPFGLQASYSYVHREPNRKEAMKMEVNKNEPAAMDKTRDPRCTKSRASITETKNNADQIANKASAMIAMTSSSDGKSLNISTPVTNKIIHFGATEHTTCDSRQVSSLKSTTQTMVNVANGMPPRLSGKAREWQAREAVENSKLDFHVQCNLHTHHCLTHLELAPLLILFITVPLTDSFTRWPHHKGREPITIFIIIERCLLKVTRPPRGLVLIGLNDHCAKIVAIFIFIFILKVINCGSAADVLGDAFEKRRERGIIVFVFIGITLIDHSSVEVEFQVRALMLALSIELGVIVVMDDYR
ncbi:serine/threonine-protein kinase 4-like [Pyrus ussuriensis x Pyrus communis]|uniref:Serine/threonine-protein kinase 4-like n=1 Tax=Pyrus ussuriensis x Pyrus communis TaxID=2448454 RepID=A0A5N5HKD2_9ROSA|nr:serine/threonine-protein kinase 4-like [Pyrus ussuriensis x Pyrus communis]